MNFKKVAMMSIAVLGIIFLGCQGLKSYSEDELGLRKTTLFNENATIEAYDYSGKVAGESMLIERAFEKREINAGDPWIYPDLSGSGRDADQLPEQYTAGRGTI